MNELEGRGGGGIVISDEHIPFSAYQAIYHKITSRVERISKDFDEAYVVTVDDIKGLNSRIVQLVAQYNVQGARCQVTHTTKDGYVHTFSAMERFIVSDKTSRSTTTAMGYEFDFLIVLPAEIAEAKEIAQRYKLQMIFEQEEINKDDIGVPFFLKDIPLFGGIKMKLEYSDYSVAQAVEAVVSGWVSSLPKREVPNFVKIVSKSEQILARFAATSIRSMAILAGAIDLYLHPRGFSSSVSLSMFCIALGFLSYSIVEYAVGNIFKAVRNFSPCPIVIITKGDGERREKIDKRLERSRGAMGIFAVSFALAIVVNCLSAWIYGQLFSNLR